LAFFDTILSIYFFKPFYLIFNLTNGLKKYEDNITRKKMNRRIVPRTSPNEEKEICIYQFKESDVLCYTIKNGYTTITKENFSLNLKRPRDSPVTLVRYDDTKCMIKLSDYLNAMEMKSNLIDSLTQLKIGLKEQCELLNKEAELLKTITDGKINLYKTGNAKKTAIQLWYDLCNPPLADKISESEALILEMCHGAFMYGIKYRGIGYKYDVCSEYPGLMASNQHKYPIKEGELKTYSREEFDKLQFFSFGMYHVNVTNADYRVFRTNQNNWYTHTDLNFAKSKLKLTITLIEDGEVNALLYDNTKLVSGHKLFGPFVEYLFKLKKSNKCIKKYLNVLWGGLCKTNTMTITDNVIYENKIITSITPTNNGKFIFETVKPSCYYDSDYARIKPFMLSYGRMKIANIILTNLDKVVRCHTDGIICKEPITNIKFGNELGDLKYEGSSYCEINNNMYRWDEKMNTEFELLLEIEKERKFKLIK
jgi:hypothetical protein